MLKLMKYLKKGAVFAIIAPLFMFLEVIMDLLQPTLMSDIIDIGVANGDMGYIFATGGKMLLFAFFGVIGGIGCMAASSVAGSIFGTQLRQSIFDKIQNFSFMEIDKLKTSSLITRVTNDVTQLQNIVLMALRIMVRSPLLCIGGIIMALSISPRLSVIFLFVIPIITVVVILVTKKAFPMFSKVQSKIDRVNEVMRENLLGVRVIKAFCGYSQESKRFGKANKELMETSIAAQNVTILMFPAITIILNFSVVAVLWFGGRLHMIGGIEAGKIMAFINYLTQIMQSLMMSVMLFISLSRAKASADRINEVLNTKTSITENPFAKTAEHFDVEFKNVSFKYSTSGNLVLEDISFRAEEGQTIGIIGATGSGKSSLINLIPRLYDVCSGEVLIGGINVKDIKLKQLRDNIGVVLQESVLFAGTLGDNLRFGKEDADSAELEEASRAAQALEFIDTLPQKYESPVEQRGKNFSGGQKQRISIARTLVRKPHILIMDDSSSALDMTTEAKLQEALKNYMHKCTTFIIAQRISGVMYCDKILVLDGGRVSGFGTHNELLSSNDIYRNIVISQLGEEAAENGNA